MTRGTLASIPDGAECTFSCGCVYRRGERYGVSQFGPEFRVEQVRGCGDGHDGFHRQYVCSGANIVWYEPLAAALQERFGCP